jgi:uncharacterized protein YqeY
MSIEAKLLDDMKSAMKSGDTVRLETIRMLRAQLKNASLGKQEALPEQDVLAILAKEAKKRKESIELYRQGGREDLVESETKELEIIEAYLPAALTEQEIDEIIGEAIQQSGATGVSDMGKVMGRVMSRVKGRADGKMIQNRVRQKLGA